MEMSELHTDGNAAAGLLQEIFVAEVTAAERICHSCGARRPIGAHRAFAGAGAFSGPGVVLRCPDCGDMAGCIVELPGETLLELRGRLLFRREPI